MYAHSILRMRQRVPFPGPRQKYDTLELESET